MKIHWMIFVALITIIVQAWVARKWMLKGITYNRFFSVSRAFEGEEIEMVERISNRKLLPVPWLRIESKISQNLEFKKQFNLDIKHEQFHKSLFSLMPYTAINRRHQVKCKKRGCYRLNSAALTCGDLFGFQDATKVYELDAQILVYPKLVNLDEIPFLSRSWMGDVVVKRWIIDDPFMYAGVREYTAGDPLNSINWKATARTGNLQVHKRDYTADPRIMIYLNMDVREDMWGPITDPELIEKGISYAASIVNHAIAQGIDTGFGTNGYVIDQPEESVRILPRGGEEQLILLLDTMAKLVIDRSVTFYTFIEEDIKYSASAAVSGAVDYLFITTHVSERMQNQIKQLEDMGNSVEILWLEDTHKAGVSHEG
ncbi:MAG: DUF58 domain-containing protein [Caldicoprobacterales bacterium]|jgi:uncharacterized protein (DUF58 family)|nr:DUF58 domain-containing protein [Clostridiales bacterium]